MVVRPVSAGYYHRYRRGIAIPLANTDTHTNTNYASGIMHHPGPHLEWTSSLLGMPRQAFRNVEVQ